MNLWVLSFHKKVPAGVGCVTPQAEPAPDFASWHTVRFCFTTRNELRRKMNLAMLYMGIKHKNSKHPPKRVQNSATTEPFSYIGKLSIQFPCLLRYATKKVENVAFMA